MEVGNAMEVNGTRSC